MHAVHAADWATQLDACNGLAPNELKLCEKAENFSLLRTPHRPQEQLVMARQNLGHAAVNGTLPTISEDQDPP